MSQINLLPPELRQRQAIRRNTSFVIVVGLAVLALIGLFYFFQVQRLSQTQSDLAEIELPALRALATETRQAREFVEEFSLSDGRRLYLIADGRLVNLAAAEGHPAQVMDMSFANQALSAEYVVQNAASLEKKVYVVPEEIDKQIARLKLATMGV